MDELKEKDVSVNITTEASVSISKTVVETEVCEGQVQTEEGAEEGGPSNGDDIMVEVLGSHVYVDGICTTDGGGGVEGDSNNEAVRAHDESGEAGEGGRTRSELSGGEASVVIETGKGRNEVNGAGIEDSGAPGSSSGEEATKSVAERTSGTDANQSIERQKVGGCELDNGSRKAIPCLSAAVDDSSVQTADVSGRTNKSDDVVADSKPLDERTPVSAEDVSHSVAKDSVSSCQSTELIVKDQFDEKGNLHMETDKQGTASEHNQTEVNSSHQIAENHATGNGQSVKAQNDGGEEFDLSMGEAMEVDKKSSDTKSVVSDAKKNVEVEKMDVGAENHACEDSEFSGPQTDTFVGSDGDKLSKVDYDSKQIPASFSSGKVLCSSETEDQLVKTAASEDDSIVGKDMDVEDVTGALKDDVDQMQEMEVEEHDSESEQHNNIDDKTVKRTAVKSVSAAKVHQAKYELMSEEEEGNVSVSDLVWGKVRSHPWWPGQIFDPSDASEKAIKYCKKDSFLVAYFGDRTFAWNEASVLKPFRSHFSQIAKQSNLESFQNAVECALEEVSRRVELGFACPCILQDVYDRIKFQKVENAGVRQESSIRDGVEMSLSAGSFKPDKLVEFIKDLAESPSGGGDRLDLVIAKAQLLAFYRLKGYQELPEFQSSEEKLQFGEVTEHATTYMDMDGKQVSSDQETSQRSSHLKRKHNLKDGLYPSKKERSLSELMVETFDSPDVENGSVGKKRKTVDSKDSMVQEGRKTISLAKVSGTTPNSPKSSFKIGECIRRAASQMAGSPSILKCKPDGGSESPAGDGYDVFFDNSEDSQQKRMIISAEYSSLDKLLLQLHLAACDPMNNYSSLNIIVSFFSDFRDSLVVDQLPGDKAGGKRKRSTNSIISPETFEFEDMNDTYWTDRIVQNGSEEQSSHGNGKGQYQIVPVELDKPVQVQKGRKSRKRYSDVNHDLPPEKPTGYVDERAPAELVMNFSEINSVPSETKLNKMFKHFGPLKESETEVDRETSRARVVFRRSSDAEVAYNSAGKFNIFGSVAVNYQLNYTISESFKASLYAPTLAEESLLLTSSLGGDHTLGASTLGEASLIAPNLGEEASYMVSTLGMETLPITSAFHEESSMIASTLGDHTFAIHTTLGNETSVISTTMYEETLPIAMYEETLPIATIAGDEIMDVATTIGDQSYMFDTAVGQQSSTIVTTVSEQKSTIMTTLGEETSTVNVGFGEETSTIATLGQETPSIPSALGEETPSIPTTSGEVTPGIPTTLNEDSLTSAMTSGEETPNIPVSMGEETPTPPPTLSEAAQTIPPTFTEATPTILPTLGQESTITSATPDQETQAIPSTMREETKTILATWGEETTTIPATLHEENPAIPTTLAVEAPTITTSLVEEASAIPTSVGEENPTKNITLTEETFTVLATLAEETSTKSTTLYEETLTTPEVTSTIPATTAEETSTIPAFISEETSTIPVTKDEETPIISVTMGEETATFTKSMGEETSTVAKTMGEETSIVTKTVGEETSTVTNTVGEETSTTLATLAEETSNIPTKLGEEATTVKTPTAEETSTTKIETLPPEVVEGEQSAS